MKKVFFALILSVWTVNFAMADSESSLKRYEEECLSFIDKPKVEVTSSYGKLRYSYDKDEAYLKAETAKKFREQGEDMPADFVPIGLTKVRDRFDFSLEVGQIEVSKGYVCLYPSKIKAHLGYYVPTIYILNSLKKDSCLYDLSLRHEKTHMQIYIEALDYFLPAFKKTAEGLFERAGVKIAQRGDDLEKAARELNDAYLKIISSKVDVWHKEVEAEQLKLDTPENYIIENKICAEIDEKEE